MARTITTAAICLDVSVVVVTLLIELPLERDGEAPTGTIDAFRRVNALTVWLALCIDTPAIHNSFKG